MSDPLEVFQDMMDRAWEQELALFLGQLHNDLVDGYITAEQARQRMDQIRSRKP